MRRPAVLAVAVLLLVACGLSLWQVISDDETPGGSTSAEPTKALPKEGFENYFVPGTPVRIGEEAATVAVLAAADTEVPTGRFIACDPLVQATNHYYERPFATRIEPGDYRTEIAVAVLDNGTKLPLAARMLVLPEPVTRWQLALREGEDARKLGPNQFYGFAVDSGMAGFVDAGTLDALTRVAGDGGPLMTARDKDMYAGFWSARDETSGDTITAITSGYGDGSYPTWLGRSATDQPAQFLIDFLVIDPPGYQRG